MGRPPIGVMISWNPKARHHDDNIAIITISWATVLNTLNF